MTTALVLVTVVCLFIPVYVYAGYPALLWLASRCKRPHGQGDAGHEPSVTLVISCYNEADVIARKLENSLALDYPGNKLAILVVSDGSDDGTDDIVKGFADKGICLIRQEGRLGKTMGLNLAVEAADSEIIVFSDANAMYDTQAVRYLVRHFSHEKVGYAVGAALYTDADTGASAHNENLYWRYELAIKTWESRLHSVVGGDGAIYAIRSRLWQPLQQRDINDFVNPLQIIAQGYRGRFEPRAQCFEETAGSFDKEIARKERIVNRSIRGLMRVKSVMNPLKTGVFSSMVISHKLLRWLIPYFLVLGVAGSALLASQSLVLFQLITLGSLGLLLLATTGQLWREKTRLPTLLSLPYYFVMVNAYAMKGIYKALRGETQVTWSSARPDAAINPQEKSGSHSLPLPTKSLLLLLVSLVLLGASLGLPYV